MMSCWKNPKQGLLWIAALLALTQAGIALANSRGDAKDAKHSQASPAPTSDGERKFAQNCARCHNPPEGFSPHISGTIVMHMRVRASLSKRDEEDILRFLNP
jgi:mono/diheme cytochrome c family protein